MNSCPVCHGHKLISVVSIKGVPIFCNLLFNDRNKALSIPQGDIELTYCEHCGHLFNKAFDPAIMEYDDRYENALDYSPVFQNYLSKLTDSLIDRYGLTNKKVVDVGCGQGEFLLQLCEKGNNTGIGYDPSHRFENETQTKDLSVTFVQDYYSEKYSSEQADFISSRHVLEHIHEPNSFVQLIRNGLAENSPTYLFIEVPNGVYTIEQLGIWDLIYEHVSYFTPASLRYLMISNNLKILDLKSVFSDQNLTVIAKSQSLPSGYNMDNSLIGETAEQFAEKFRQKTTDWQSKLNKWHERGKETVIWGAGSKGVTFLNIVDENNHIRYAIDINPRKKDKFIAGSGQQIKSPDFLKEWNPDVILIMNPIYEKEIKGMIGRMNIHTEIFII